MQFGMPYGMMDGYGMGYGFCLTTMMAAYADVFQGPRLGAILGYLTLGGLLGGALGTAAGGYLRDVTGNYQTNFLLATLAFASSVALVWSAKPGSVRIVRKIDVDLSGSQKQGMLNETVPSK